MKRQNDNDMQTLHPTYEELQLENADLRLRLARLEQDVIVAAMWCNDCACEFKHLRRDAPTSVEEAHSVMLQFGWGAAAE